MTFNEKYKDNALLIKTFNFSLKIIDYTEALQEKKKFVIANQLLKSGTSIGANSKEAQNAESKADFIHKLKIGVKELNETEVWLRIIVASNMQTAGKIAPLLDECRQLQRIIGASIATARK